MGAEPKSSVDLSDFPGLVNTVDPRETPPGAAFEQVNVCSVTVGTLEVRHGYKVVLFDPY